MENKEWYSTKELVEAPWFPLDSTHKVMQAIREDRLVAKNFGSSTYSMWRIKKEWAIEFINNPQKNGKS